MPPLTIKSLIGRVDFESSITAKRPNYVLEGKRRETLIICASLHERKGKTQQAVSQTSWWNFESFCGAKRCFKDDLRKSCTTADVFHPCRRANLPLIIALCPPAFRCVPLKSPSKCGRQRLSGASALPLPSCAHCARFAGCLCFFVFFLRRASIKFRAPRFYASVSA